MGCGGTTAGEWSRGRWCVKGWTARFTGRPRSSRTDHRRSGSPRPSLTPASPARLWRLREILGNNAKPSAAGERSWELSGGILRCGVCGFHMRIRSAWNGKGAPRRYYYTCGKSNADKAACPHRKNHRAIDLEAGVWDHVSGLMKDPEQLRDDLERMIELKREGLRGDPDREVKAWLKTLTDVNNKRAAFQDMAAEGLISFDELRSKLAALEETRETAERELAALKGHSESLEQMERDKEAVLEHYVMLAPEASTASPPKSAASYTICSG
jgi:hypothetical protein